MEHKKNDGRFKMLDLTGVKSGMLTAIFAVYYRHSSYYWRCKCECGNETDVLSTRIKNGITKSCGCLKFKKGQNQTHGLRKHPIYNVWTGMKERCLNKKSKKYPDYGGRGILMCKEWEESFVNFYNDMKDGYVKGLHLDRKENDKGYSKENCRWVTPLINNNNRRSCIYICMDGRTHTPAEWGRELGGGKDDTINHRRKRGWTDFEALFGLK
jgi:hypothetical protein